MVAEGYLAVFCPLQASLSSSRSSRTTFIVAHRLSTISDADLIVVLKEGVVAEAGRHGELLEAGGLYAELWSKQAHQGGGGGGSEGLPSARGSQLSLAELDGQSTTSGATAASVALAAAAGTGTNVGGGGGAAHHHHQ